MRASLGRRTCRPGSAWPHAPPGRVRANSPGGQAFAPADQLPAVSGSAEQGQPNSRAPLLSLPGLPERVRAFLAASSGRGAGEALAKACLDDLAAFGPLSDWRQDNDLPAAAAEACQLALLMRQTA